MKTYTDTDRACIMAESRAILKRLEGALVGSKEKQTGELIPLDRVERWKRQAEKTEESRARARTERKEQTVEVRLNAKVERVAAEVRAEIASSRSFALEVVGEALGHFRNELADEISEAYRSAFAKVEASLETLRANPRRSREDDDRRAIDLPLLRGRLQ